jgi:hypothetical protein
MTRLIILLCVALFAPGVLAWDYANHRLINQLALSTLPTNFPSFVRSSNAVERISFLGGEPDRWRNVSTELPLKHQNNPDHYFDCEYIEELGLDWKTISSFRYDFVEQLFEAEKKNPKVVNLGDPSRDLEHTKRLIGFLPWTITEQFAKLRSGFSYLKAFERFGSPEEITNAQANIIYAMGTLGHFPGDGCQPLHMTKHYNGWTTTNAMGYTMNPGFHALIDGDFLKIHPLNRAALEPRLRPAKLVWKGNTPEERRDVFHESIDWLREQYAQVQPLYKLEKEGKLKPGTEQAKEGVAFLEKQILVGAQFLGDLWLTAWQESQPDRFLIQALQTERKANSP